MFARHLTQKDQSVLGTLFDGVATIDVDGQSTSTTFQHPLPKRLEQLQARESHVIKILNKAEPDQKDIEKAIAELTEIIKENPDYASAYNNRAQALRLLLKDDIGNNAVVENTLYQDLCTAIKLAAPENALDPLSPYQAKLLAGAYTQRGIIILNYARNTGLCDTQNLPTSLHGLGKNQLEEIAAINFNLGGKYGNTVARQLAVQLNPYAKMCGEIVKEALLADLESSRQESLM